MKQQHLAQPKIVVDPEELRALVAELVSDELRGPIGPQPPAPPGDDAEEYQIEWVAC
jgi:hypothetical protein